MWHCNAPTIQTWKMRKPSSKRPQAIDDKKEIVEYTCSHSQQTTSSYEQQIEMTKI